MYFNSISLTNYRSYIDSCFKFQPSGAQILGPNGSGKTNLLESLAYFGFGKSIRYHHDDALINHDQIAFSLSSEICMDTGLLSTMQINFDKTKKSITQDNNTIKRMSLLYERIKVIYCAPEDINLINGSPRLRRQYFDQSISQLYPDYLHVLRNYLHILEQRNKLLKSEPNKAMKRIWDARFAESCIDIYKYRDRYIEILNSEFEGNYQEFSNRIRYARLNYEYCKGTNSALYQSTESIVDYLERYSNLEYKLQRTTIGPHLDDYMIINNNHDIQVYGSQGQKRVIVLLLKLIQASLVTSVTGIKPVLLFDDVFAELDSEHSDKVKGIIGMGHQVFIASPKIIKTNNWIELPVIEL